ncbi:cytochrome c [Lacimicrobium alkaliphilum]|uniref:Cytochrome C n=1 Tax=Lacimicrobium alkaliphilum TaxID=1526571 RepID=A0A0U2ZAB2_9ALTE|nr:cytochrome c [Lacimicrobium alkaliphilum]ALS99859.1 cytochrome C [Lacimicrobium alkaliphilum]
MQQKSLLRNIIATTAVIGIIFSTVSLSEAKNSIDGESMALRKIMNELGKDMQSVTDAISREEWLRVAEIALQIAEHPQPPIGEKMRILSFVGSDAGKFKEFDKQTHDAAKAMESAAKLGNGQAVIESFSTLQTKCLACHQNFREEFLEHFYNKR